MIQPVVFVAREMEVIAPPLGKVPALAVVSKALIDSPDPGVAPGAKSAMTYIPTTDPELFVAVALVMVYCADFNGR